MFDVIFKSSFQILAGWRLSSFRKRRIDFIKASEKILYSEILSTTELVNERQFHKTDVEAFINMILIMLFKTATMCMFALTQQRNEK